MKSFIVLALHGSLILVNALPLTPNPNVSSRRGVIQAVASAVPLAFFGATSNADTTTTTSEKLALSDAEIKEIVKNDLVIRQFLVTGNLTPSIYKPTATFTDEIDTYKMDQWITGTQKLFVGEKSEVRLVGDVDVNAERIEFRFDEDLMFRIPFRPVVSLTGKVVLERDETGYITSYREFWDQDVFSVLKSAKF